MYQSPACSFFELAVVKNYRSAVSILMLFVILSYFLRQLYAFPLFAAMLTFPIVRLSVSIDRRQPLRFCRSPKPPICRWNFFDPNCHSSKDTSISGFGGHIDDFRLSVGIIFIWEYLSYACRGRTFCLYF